MSAASRWFEWTCCGLWLFGKPESKNYNRVVDKIESECSQRVKTEINMGLPPGVSIGDLIHGNKSAETLHQAHMLAQQSNFITDYLNRFNAAEIPDSCQGIVSNQIVKLKAMQNVIWNAMISLATGNVEIKESSLQTLLDKQACETMALMEMEKLAAAISMDSTSAWAKEISQLVTSQPAAAASDNLKTKEDPIYDDPEGFESSMLLQPNQQKRHVQCHS